MKSQYNTRNHTGIESPGSVRPQVAARIRSQVVLFACQVVALICTVGAATTVSGAEGRPNILWITVEDMSPTLGCYGDTFANTPNLDAFAKTSVRFSHAFASSPVCSPSRSCLITGTQAPILGTHNMRSEFPLPDSVLGFPARLRDLGYYTTNNVKTDYNTSSAEEIIRVGWDENSSQATWRNRRGDQPFFAVFNLMTTHQSRTMVWSYDEFVKEIQSKMPTGSLHDPKAVPLPPYYPDTPLIRKTVARYYDCVSYMDTQVGKILDDLREDGLDENTIVFFYSDHGSGMPRHKRLLLDSGMRVPLMIRFPRKFAHLAPKSPGETCDRLVSFEDFGPTVQRLAGIEQLDDYMTGQPFLGEHQAAPREYVFGHRDRIDEVVDMARSIRDKRYLLIRNYMPHLSYNQPSAWVDQSEMSHVFYGITAQDDGAMTPSLWHFVRPQRETVELYDYINDPMNLENLASRPQFQHVVKRLSDRLERELLETKDLGFLPETQQTKIAEDQPPMLWRMSEAYDLETILEVVKLIGSGKESEIRRWTTSHDAAVRYWAMVALSACPSLDPKSSRRLTEALHDVDEMVRIEAATALAGHGELDPALAVLASMLEGDRLDVVLRAARAVEMLGEDARSLHPQMQALMDRFAETEGDAAWFIRFTTTGYLNRVEK